MKRRDFISASAAMIGGGFLAPIRASAQTTPLAPVRTGRLFTNPNASIQDVIFDGGKFLSLYHSPGARGPNFSVAASTPSGALLWDYPLPAGVHVSLGTHGGSVISMAAGHLLPSGPRILNPVWLIDPSTGDASQAGVSDGKGVFRYAGDSTFFRVASGQGEIWTFDGALTNVAAGLQSSAFAAKFSEQGIVSPDTIAVVTADGNWVTRVSTAGTVQENPITSDFVTNVRSFYASFYAAVYARQGIDPSKKRIAQTVIISAIGGDQNGSIYAFVSTPKDPKGVVPLIRFDHAGGASVLGKLQLPLTASGHVNGANKLFVVNSQLAVVSWLGDTIWYPLPPV